MAETSEAKQKIKRDTCCCVVQFYSERDLSEFKRRYHGRHWTDRKGAMLPSVCIVNKVKHEPRNQPNAEAIEGQEMQQDKEKKYLTRRQRVERARQKMRAAETQSLEVMPELHPPKALLPQVRLCAIDEANGSVLRRADCRETWEHRSSGFKIGCASARSHLP